MINIITPRDPLRIGIYTYIKAPTKQDVKMYLAFLKRNEAFHKPWVYHSIDPKYYEHYLNRIKRGVAQGCFVFDLKSDALVGVININNIQLGAMSMASLGYFGGESYAGKGYMTEGMGLVLRYAVEKIGLHRIEANIQPKNIASKKLVKRLGFRKEGFSPKYMQIGGKWCDHERWTILDEEVLRWQL